MTAQEFLQSKQIYKLISDDGELNFSMFEIMKWMEQYGKQCFEAGREFTKDMLDQKYTTFKDYLKSNPN